MADDFKAKIVHMSSIIDVAEMIRSIGEQAHQTDKVNMFVQPSECYFMLAGLGIYWLG